MADNSLPPFWYFDEVAAILDRWEADERPSQQQVVAVTQWLADRMDNPYLGVQREPVIPHLWMGAIPGSEWPDGRIVTCAYFINDAERVLKCNEINSQRPPFARRGEVDYIDYSDEDDDPDD